MILGSKIKIFPFDSWIQTSSLSSANGEIMKIRGEYWCMLKLEGIHQEVHWKVVDDIGFFNYHWK
jgi:hypothetical protein